MYNVTGQPAVSVPLHWTGGSRRCRSGSCWSAGRPTRRRCSSLSAQLEAARARGSIGTRPVGEPRGLPPRAPRSTEPQGECPGGVRYRNRVTVWQTVLVFVVIPLAGLAVLAALTFAPGANRSPRYRVGRSWDYEPVWYIARPDVVGAGRQRRGPGRAGRRLPARADRAGHAAGRRRSSTRTTGTARGGASGEW